MELKQILIWFSITFLLFGLIGYKEGYDERSREDFLATYFFEEASIIQIKDYTYIAYKVDNRCLYVFNVDNNRLIQIDSSALFKRDEFSIPDKNLLTYLNTKTMGFIGGAGILGYTVKDVFKNSESAKQLLSTSKGKSSLIGAVLGSVSGFSFGYWLSIYSFKPSEKSKEAIDILSSENNWKRAKKKIFNHKWIDLEIRINHIDDELNKSRLQKEDTIMESHFRLDSLRHHDYSSSDFQRLSALSDNVEVSENPKASHMLRIFCCILFLVTAIFLIYYISTIEAANWVKILYILIVIGFLSLLIYYRLTN